MAANIKLPETRCPFCHELVIAGKDAQHGCESCRAWHHLECWKEHGGCSTCSFRSPEDESFDAVKNHIIGKRKMQFLKELKGGDVISEEVAAEVIRRIKGNPAFEEIYDVVASNTTGKVYLVGGKVYRTLTSVAHQIDCGALTCDWDFLTFDIKNAVTIPKKWMYEVTDDYWGTGHVSSYDCEKEKAIVRLKKRPEARPTKTYLHAIDIMNIRYVYGIEEFASRVGKFWPFTKGRVNPTIINYFRAVPFDIQAIALDFVEERILGMGIAAVLRKEVGVNNKKAAEFQAVKKKTSIPELLREKAKSLKFEPRIPRHYEDQGLFLSFDADRGLVE